MPLLHCTWLVVRVGVLCCILAEGDPRTPLFAALGLTASLGFLVRVSVLCVLAFHARCVCALISLSLFPPFSFSLFLSLSQRAPVLICTPPALRDIHEAPHHGAVLKHLPASGASRLRRFAPAAPRERAVASRCCFGGPGLRCRPLALGNAQRYQTNDAR
jgi:hypothetical protein